MCSGLNAANAPGGGPKEGFRESGTLSSTHQIVYWAKLFANFRNRDDALRDVTN